MGPLSLPKSGMQNLVCRWLRGTGRKALKWLRAHTVSGQLSNLPGGAVPQKGKASIPQVAVEQPLTAYAPSNEDQLSS